MRPLDGRRNTNLHEGGTRFPPQPGGLFWPTAEPKGRAEKKKGTIDTSLFSSQSGSQAPNVFSREKGQRERERGEGVVVVVVVGVERHNVDMQIQRGTLSMLQWTLTLKIMNSEIMCNLSECPPAYRELLHDGRVGDSNTFLF